MYEAIPRIAATNVNDVMDGTVPSRTRNAEVIARRACRWGSRAKTPGCGNPGDRVMTLSEVKVLIFWASGNIGGPVAHFHRSRVWRQRLLPETRPAPTLS